MAKTLIAGRYRLDSLLGRGGMSEVWCATDLELGRRVALKLLASHEDNARFAGEGPSDATTGRRCAPLLARGGAGTRCARGLGHERHAGRGPAAVALRHRARRGAPRPAGACRRRSRVCGDPACGRACTGSDARDDAHRPSPHTIDDAPDDHGPGDHASPHDHASNDDPPHHDNGLRGDVRHHDGTPPTTTPTDTTLPADTATTLT